MADYFKFCPKCGRVLDRDWCPHCEPEKEKQFRKQQSKLDDQMVEGYSYGEKTGRFLNKAKKVKTNSKAFTKMKEFESGRESRRENRREGRGEFWNEPRTSFGKDNHSGSGTKSKTGMDQDTKKRILFKTIIPVIIAVVFASSLPGIIIGAISNSISSSGEASSFFDKLNNSPIGAFFDEDMDYDEEDTDINSDELDDTISLYSFDNLLYMQPYYDYVPDAQYKIMRDQEFSKEDYHYKIDDRSYGYYFSVYNFVSTENDEKASDGIQKTIDKLYATYKAKAELAKKNKTKVTGSVIGYVTYYNDGYVNLVLDTYESTGDGEKRYSYMVNLDTLELLPENKSFTKENKFYKTALNALKDYNVTKEDLQKCINEGKYYYTYDQEGIVWVGFQLNNYGYKNVKFDYAQFNGKDIDY